MADDDLQDVWDLIDRAMDASPSRRYQRSSTPSSEKCYSPKTPPNETRASPVLFTIDTKPDPFVESRPIERYPRRHDWHDNPKSTEKSPPNDDKEPYRKASRQRNNALSTEESRPKLNRNDDARCRNFRSEVWKSNKGRWNDHRFPTKNYYSHNRFDDETCRRKLFSRPWKNNGVEKKRRGTRQVFDHGLDVSLVLCVRGNSYTISNGFRSVSEDGCPNWQHQLIEDMEEFGGRGLYLVGAETETVWKELKREFQPLQEIKVHALDDRLVGKCKYCKETECHRWKVVVGGVQKVIGRTVNAIPH